MESGDWARQMAYNSEYSGLGHSVEDRGQEFARHSGSHFAVPALDSSEAAVDDDLDLAVSKLVPRPNPRPRDRVFLVIDTSRPFELGVLWRFV
jgi:hypothetical protein